MRSLLAISALLVLGSSTGAVRAEGLLHALPEDGTWVRYDMKIQRDGEEAVEKGSLTVSSVGRLTEGNDSFRWIEYKIERPGLTTLIKFLIPEKRFKGGAKPLRHAVKCWNVYEDEVGEISVPLEGRPLIYLWRYLPGPLDESKKLEKAIVDSKLGALECEGLHGTAMLQEKYRYTYTLRLHKKAPFGIVSFRSVQGEQATTLTLAEVGKDAKSTLPDYR